MRGAVSSDLLLYEYTIQQLEDPFGDSSAVTLAITDKDWPDIGAALQVVNCFWFAQGPLLVLLDRQFVVWTTLLL